MIKILLIILTTSLIGCQNSENINEEKKMTELEMTERSKYNEVYSFKEVDDRIENIWIDSNEGIVEPVDQWLKKNKRNTISFLAREEAIKLHSALKKEFSVEVSVIYDDSTPDYAVYLVGNVEAIGNIDAIRAILADSSSSYKLTTDFGAKWFILEGAYDEEGELLAK